MRSLSTFIILTGLLLASTSLFAQGEANNWYFGINAGLNFNTTPPTPLTNGRIRTLEGATAISDATGALLFYTDGSIVYNRNHDVMENGTGLKGDESSTTSALIVPQPNSADRYIIFTVDEPHHFNADNDASTIDSDGVNNGFMYSIVDITLDNGLGAVIDTQKNIPLITYDTTDATQVAYKCSEKITAVKSETCNSFWVITHFIDSFYAFEVDQTGVNPNPVVSKTGVTVPISGYRRNALGYLKASPTADKLAVAHLGFATMTGEDAPGKIALYDFDNVTGQVTNETVLYNGDAPYGIEFSQSGSKLYATVGLGDSGIDESFIIQYDLALPQNQIAASGIRISNENGSTTSDFSSGALQIGPDGKIYRALYNFNTNDGDYLGVIENPESDANNVQYRDRGILVNTDGRRISQIGLPPFIQSIFAETIDIINNGNSNDTNLALCQGQGYRLSYQMIPGATYRWYFNNQLTTNNTPFFDINNEGNYRLEVDPNNGSCPLIGVANVTRNQNPAITNVTLSQCDISLPLNDGRSIFNLEEANSFMVTEEALFNFSFYQDSADAINEVNEIPNPQSYQNQPNQIVYVRAVNKVTGCAGFGELQLKISTTTANDIVWAVCDEDGMNDGFTSILLNETESALIEGLANTGFIFSYHLSPEDALSEQNPITTYQNTVAYSQGTEIIYARIEDTNNNCFGIQTINLFINTVPPVITEEEMALCTDKTLSIPSGIKEAGQNVQDYEYLWSTGETTESISITQNGTYTVTIIDKDTGCSIERKITTISSEPARIERVLIKDAQENNEVIIEVSGSGVYEYALETEDLLGDFQDSTTFTNVSAGTYRIVVKDKNGCGEVKSDFFTVISFPAYFTPNGDTFHETWNLEGIQDASTTTSLIRIFDRNGKLLKQIAPGSSGWDGTYQGKLMPSSQYWFKATLENNREVTGSFALIR
ncbi:T9SS type B sorting domain-containing protein [Aquimarina sp. ERC-38]|uniref:T9SS type B sorting domain-containing protein n=1 Tax=Aquimarina sp. ERC-38 TaxID=2949996 RepID=UPI002245491C|nr:T9SS type B sorting domain-containing protein [Aquimarina sp. ERC-38]UZO80870.1 T9SS type B sorting domain-containing protein [Aquimarina sp. ERC-38]